MPLDTVREAKETAVKAMQQASSSAAEALDDGMHAASHAALSSAVFLKENTERAIDEGQVLDASAHPYSLIISGA